MNIQAMMQQAKQMQERLQQQMADLRVEATAGGGMVTVVLNGAKQVQSIKLDPEVVSSVSLTDYARDDFFASPQPRSWVARFNLQF